MLFLSSRSKKNPALKRSFSAKFEQKRGGMTNKDKNGFIPDLGC